MEQRRIGGLTVSVIGVGGNNFGGRLDATRTAAVVDAALAAGINFFDTADVYGGTHSEEYLGRALKGKRAQAVIATKFGMPVDESHKGASPAYVREAVENSLRRLGTDYIDLYQLHRVDPDVPVGETLVALDDLVRAGKVREIGCSNFSAAQLSDAAAAVAPGAARFVTVQNEYSLLHREPERATLAECERLGVAFLPFFPLASGLLSGKYEPGQPPPPGARLSRPGGLTPRFMSPANTAKAAALRAFAERRGHTLLELAFSWLAGQPAVASVIAGATSPEQVQANARAAGWKLTSEDRAEIDRLAPLPPLET
jgi:aryl-alcohol dehydrogenase-like predicted oxidoreductase